MDTALLALLAFPLIWPFISKHFWGHKINTTEMVIQIVGVSLITVAVWTVGTWSATQDTEVWNGVVTSKARTEGTYEQSYDCMCSTDSNGNRSCSTCYETHYTVDWRANTTVGGITFKSLDSTSRSVYNTQNPASYKKCFVGEPATSSNSYTNYVQAVPDSLFANNESLAALYKGNIPAQPKVFGFYHYNRVIDPDNILDAEQKRLLDEHLDMTLRSMGATHQVNIIVILTKITDPNFKTAVENAWGGGEKNDVVVFIGANEDGTVAWADVMTWALNSGNELLQVVLRDELLEIPSIDASNIGQTIVLNVDTHFVRPKMKEYEYLKDSIEPPTWAIILAVLFAIGGSLLSSFLFIRHEVDDVIGDFINKIVNRK